MKISKKFRNFAKTAVLISFNKVQNFPKFSHIQFHITFQILMQFQNKKAGTGPSWHPAQVSKNEVSSNMQRTLILKLLSVSQCRKIPQEIRRRLGNHFSSNWKQKKSFFFAWTKLNYVDINYYIRPKFQHKRRRHKHNGICRILFAPRGRLGGLIRHMD